jgi:hypothetical protein
VAKKGGPAQVEDFPARQRVPHLDYLVFGTAREQTPTVAAEGQAGDYPGVSAQGLQ